MICKTCKWEINYRNQLPCRIINYLGIVLSIKLEVENDI